MRIQEGMEGYQEHPYLWIRYSILGMTALAVMYFFIQIPDLILSFGLAAVLSWAFFQPIEWLQKKGCPRLAAVGAVYGGAAGLLVLGLAFLVPRMVQDLQYLQSMVSEVSIYIQISQDWFEQWQSWNLPPVIQQGIQENVQEFQNQFFQFFQRFLLGIGEISSKVLSWMVAPILSFYLLKDWPVWKETFLQFFTPSIRREICLAAEEINQVLKNFITGQLMVSLVVGGLTGTAAWVLGIQFAWMIALLGMAGNWIPYLGAVFSGVPAVILAWMQSPADAGWMILALILIQQIESNIVTPRIIGKKLDLNQLTVLFVVLAGGQMGGIWGMMAAVPVAASLKMIVKRVYFMIV